MCNYEGIMERYYCKVALSFIELFEQGVHVCELYEKYVKAIPAVDGVHVKRKE